MVADTKSISAMPRSASKSTPATRPSKFLLRQILRPMPRNAAASPFSTSHGTCSVRRLERLPGVRQRAASKTAWFADGRLGLVAGRDASPAPRCLKPLSSKSTRTGPKTTLPSPVLQFDHSFRVKLREGLNPNLVVISGKPDSGTRAPTKLDFLRTMCES